MLHLNWLASNWTRKICNKKKTLLCKRKTFLSYKHVCFEFSLGKSDPFLIFSKIREDGSYVPVHKTPVIKNTLNPVCVERLCSAQSLRFSHLFVYAVDGDHSPYRRRFCVAATCCVNSKFSATIGTRTAIRI
jgi:hypothetical protein